MLYAGVGAGSLAWSFAVVHNMLADCMVICWAIRGIVYVGIRKAELKAHANRRVRCKVLRTLHPTQGALQGAWHQASLARPVAVWDAACDAPCDWYRNMRVSTNAIRLATDLAQHARCIAPGIGQ